MILTTTNSIDDYKILTYKGIVSGCAIKMPKIIRMPAVPFKQCT